MKIHKYKCLEKLGNGRFGSVYKGQHEITGKFVAIKLEPLQEIQTIKHETIMLNYLHSKSCNHIPKIHWFGVFDHTMCLVMSYYDCSLYDYMMNHAYASTSDIRHIIQSVLHALKSIHESGVVHRDIKPQNIMITRNAKYSGDKVEGIRGNSRERRNASAFGSSSEFEAVLIDFGMATFYIDENSQHTPEIQPPKENLLGTLKYMSYYIHLGKPYSRRDDLMSLAYVYMWLTGTLYWSSSNIPLDYSSVSDSPLDYSSVSDSPLGSDSPWNQYSETHILHPKNQYIKGQKELGRIREYFHTNINSEDSRNIDEMSLLIAFVEYVYGLTFYETPRYTI